jgi:hypothetical protein
MSRKTHTMTTRRALVAMGVAIGMATAAAAQTTGAADNAVPTATAPWTGPRTPDGQPDVQGQWNKSWAGSNGANFDLEEGIDPEEIKLTGRDPKNFPRPRVVQTPDGRIPYQPWARALRQQIRNHVLNPERVVHVDSNARCLQMGIPRQSLDTGFEILQTPGFLHFVYPYNNAYRIIALDGRSHIADRIKLWQGDSVGRWEGNTLIVDVRNLNQHGWYDAYGNFHSDELRLEERWMFVSRDRVYYEVTSHDSKVFTRPWTARNEFARAPEPVEIWESGCFEGERNLEHKDLVSEDEEPRGPYPYPGFTAQYPDFSVNR